MPQPDRALSETARHRKDSPATIKNDREPSQGHPFALAPRKASEIPCKLEPANLSNPTPELILNLQQYLGNRRVRRLLSVEHKSQAETINVTPEREEPINQSVGRAAESSTSWSMHNTAAVDSGEILEQPGSTRDQF